MPFGSLRSKALGDWTNLTKSEFVATEGQTVINTVYTPGSINVYVNGSMLKSSAYVATSGTSITLHVARTAGDEIIVEKWNYKGGEEIDIAWYILEGETNYNNAADRAFAIKKNIVTTPWLVYNFDEYEFKQPANITVKNHPTSVLKNKLADGSTKSFIWVSGGMAEFQLGQVKIECTGYKGIMVVADDSYLNQMRLSTASGGATFKGYEFYQKDSNYRMINVHSGVLSVYDTGNPSGAYTTNEETEAAAFGFVSSGRGASTGNEGNNQWGGRVHNIHITGKFLENIRIVNDQTNPASDPDEKSPWNTSLIFDTITSASSKRGYKTYIRNSAGNTEASKGPGEIAHIVFQNCHFQMVNQIVSGTFTMTATAGQFTGVMNSVTGLRVGDTITEDNVSPYTYSPFVKGSKIIAIDTVTKTVTFDKRAVKDASAKTVGFSRYRSEYFGYEDTTHKNFIDGSCIAWDYSATLAINWETGKEHAPISIGNEGYSVLGWAGGGKFSEFYAGFSKKMSEIDVRGEYKGGYYIRSGSTVTVYIDGGHNVIGNYAVVIPWTGGLSADHYISRKDVTVIDADSFSFTDEKNSGATGGRCALLVSYDNSIRRQIKLGAKVEGVEEDMPYLPKYFKGKNNVATLDELYNLPAGQWRVYGNSDGETLKNLGIDVGTGKYEGILTKEWLYENRFKLTFTPRATRLTANSLKDFAGSGYCTRWLGTVTVDGSGNGTFTNAASATHGLSVDGSTPSSSRGLSYGINYSNGYTQDEVFYIDTIPTSATFTFKTTNTEFFNKTAVACRIIDLTAAYSSVVGEYTLVIDSPYYDFEGTPFRYAEVAQKDGSGNISSSLWKDAKGYNSAKSVCTKAELQQSQITGTVVTVSDLTVPRGALTRKRDRGWVDSNGYLAVDNAKNEILPYGSAFPTHSFLVIGQPFYRTDTHKTASYAGSSTWYYQDGNVA